MAIDQFISSLSSWSPSRGSKSDLIYDVGACLGDDSAYYLHKGFRVVGIEANPAAVSVLKRRFEAAISAGRYALLPKAIFDREGKAPF